MNKLKQWFIGDYLAKTEDVFVRSKIELLYSYTFSFWIIGTIFYISAIAREYYYHAYVLTFALIALSLVPFILKYTQSLKAASVWYIVQQILVSSSELMIEQNKAALSSGLWIMTFVLFSFFLFDRKWGLIIILIFQVISAICGFLSQKLSIPESEKYNDGPLEIVTPMLLNIIIVWMFIKTRKTAEDHIKIQSVLLGNKSKELEEKNKDILDSIAYAKKIQYAVLPNEETIFRSIPLSFIYYKPKDIVSGDFFWFHELNKDEYILVCADCTGHGVPGAFMTVIGSSLLNQIIVEKKETRPSVILNELDKGINSMLKQEKERFVTVQDGMDLSLIKVNKINKELCYASAKRPALLFRDKQMQELKGNKYSLGGMRTGDKHFDETKISLKEDDVLYLYTDGITDQFGGPKGKKYTSKRLKEMLHEVHMLSMPDQKNKIELAMNEWKGSYEQIDDIQLIGIRF